VDDLRVSGGASGSTEVSILTISYNIGGSVDETLNFMRETKNYLPLMKAERIEFRITDESAEIDTNARSNFSAYPEKLPSITEPIDKITEAEYQILNELTLKQTPAFFELQPTNPVSRPNPFSFEN
jgi:hypothetical protein